MNRQSRSEFETTETDEKANGRPRQYRVQEAERRQRDDHNVVVEGPEQVLQAGTPSPCIPVPSFIWDSSD